jgi:hypothetical protein
MPMCSSPRCHIELGAIQLNHDQTAHHGAAQRPNRPTPRRHHLRTPAAGILAALTLAGGTSGIVTTGSAYACSGGNCGQPPHTLTAS